MEPNLRFFDDKRILITGGGGYLGSKLAEILATTHAEIHLLDVKFNEIAVKLNTEYTHLSNIVCDLTNKEEIENAINFSQPDLVFHFAALLDRVRDFSNYDQLYKVNVEGTLNLLEGLKRVNYSGLYYASSSEVYGNKNPSPFREDQNPSPVSPYSLTKLMAENLISTYSLIKDKPYTILRLFNFYGSQMPPTFFLSQLEKSLSKNIPFEMTGGEQKRDFISIEVLIELILKVANKPKSNQEIINICSGQATSIKELALRTASYQDKLHLLRIGALPYRLNEIWEMIGDTNKLSKILSSTVD